MLKNLRKTNGFTLAEVLITLTVIGVVAAITVPTLISNVKSKTNATKKEVFMTRILNGLKETAVQDTLMGYDSTMEFTKSLGQHYKMFNVCDTNNIKACYNVDEVIIDEEKGESIEVSKIKKATNLSLKEEKGWLDPVTIVATDGTVFIMSYNKTCTVTESEVHSKENDNMALTCIDGVIDINGISAPNKQGKDILSFRSGALTMSSLTIPYIKFVNNGKTYYVSRQLTSTDGMTYKGKPAEATDWEGAKLACSSVGGRLPTSQELKAISNNKNEFSLTTPDGIFWSSTPDGDNRAVVINFNGTRTLGGGRTYPVNVLCLSL